MNENIEIVEFKEHSKASEKSALVLMKYPNKTQKFLIPYCDFENRDCSIVCV